MALPRLRPRLAQTLFLAQHLPMIATIGDAYDRGWKLRIYCRFGNRDGVKSIRECKAHVEIDLATLVWTRGREFPVARLDTRMKCPGCGSRRVLVAFEPPKNASEQTVPTSHAAVLRLSLVQGRPLVSP